MKRDYRIGIGEVQVASRGETLTCHGLGSCVGVFLHDRQLKIGGAAHIFLPKSGHETSLGQTYHAEGALSRLITKMEACGSNQNQLRAFLFGGAQLFTSSLTTGMRNVEAVREYLVQHHIYIAHQQVGGTDPISVRFDSLRGEFEILHRMTTNKPLKQWAKAS